MPRAYEGILAARGCNTFSRRMRVRSTSRQFLGWTCRSFERDRFEGPAAKFEGRPKESKAVGEEKADGGGLDPGMIFSVGLSG